MIGYRARAGLARGLLQAWGTFEVLANLASSRLGVMLVLWLAAGHAHAQLDLSRLPPVTDLASRVAVLEDDTRALTLADVRMREARFRQHDSGEVSLGFSNAALWLRFDTNNPSAQSVRWVLQLGEPTLDHVDLYAVGRDGTSSLLRGGDALPFATRSVPHAKVTFELEAAPFSSSTVYLRVQSEVVMRVPLHAYAPAAYYASHDSESLWLSLFYGALLMAAAYHFCVAALVRRVEYARYGLAALSFALVLICLNGQQAQFWFRNAPVLSERLVPVSLALSLWVTFLFIRDVIARVPGLPFDGGLYTATRRARSLLVVFSAIAPVGLSIRVVAAVLFLVSVVAVPAILYKLSQTAPAELDLYRRSWWALGLPIPIALLRFADLLPAGILDWALPAGFTLHGLAISLALPLWVSGMERRLAVVNAKLESNVQELSQALANAEEANLEAVRATKAKDDFMATMSHELRTPLNAIINIPQGLVSEFEVLPSARCAACETSFLLDDDERIGADTLCPECGAVGRLEAGTKVTFRGDDARCLRFLQKIERSGQHLLQMVNGVLDYSKLEAGRFELVLGTVALEALVREACDHMVDIAQRKGITLEVVPPEVAVTLAADELRLKQVMINLLANAIKFSEPGTAVTIRWQSSGVATQIEVEDRGIGIAPEYHERVFASFEQVHQGDTRKYGGTGLGLSISRSLVRMHGGELSVRSEPGKGSTFVVHLPRIHLSMHPANMATDSMAS